MRIAKLAASLLLIPAALSYTHVSASPTDLTPPAAIFTNPSKIVAGKQDNTIRNGLIDLVNAATSDSNIYLMIYLFHDSKLLEALILAADRGVEVNVILDWSNTESQCTNREAFNSLKKVIHSTIKTTNPLDKNHNKFALFTKVQAKTGFVNNVIFETSSNFTLGSYRKFQDAIVLSDKSLFEDGFKKYWQYVAAAGKNELLSYNYRTEYGTNVLNNGKPINKAYFFPKRRNRANYGNDTAALILRNLVNGPGNAKKVKIAMSLWSKKRNDQSPGILKQLRMLASESTNQIEIVLPRKDTNKNMIPKLERFDSDYTNVKVYIIQQNLHSKYMLISGSYTNQGIQNIVFSGSKNFTYSGLRNNFETWIKHISDEQSNNTEIYDAYINNFNAIVLATRKQQ